MEKEKIFGDIPWYYTITPEQAITVRYVVRMKDEIDGGALRRAVRETMLRYPYMMKRLVVTDREYCLVPNDLPIVVVHGKDPVNLGGKEANYHQIAISYFGRGIYFNNTHAICDGRGRSPILHTLMYYYCTYRYGEPVTMDGVNLSGSPIDPMEYDDPYTRAIPEPENDFSSLFQTREPFRLSEAGLVSGEGDSQIHCIRVKEDALMQCCKGQDATPNSALALLMCRAIDSLHPDNRKPIIPGIYCDLRKAMKSPLSHRTLVTTLDLVYDDHVRALSFSDQNTAFRGRMLLLSDPSFQLFAQKFQQEACNKVSGMATLKQKTDAACGAMAGLFKAHTFLVSYSGKSNYGSCDKYISSFFPQVHATGIDLLMEITAADGWFYVTFIQEWREDCYFNAFLKELQAQGLDCDLLYSSRNDYSRFIFEPEIFE